MTTTDTKLFAPSIQEAKLQALSNVLSTVSRVITKDSEHGCHIAIEIN